MLFVSCPCPCSCLVHFFFMLRRAIFFGLNINHLNFSHVDLATLAFFHTLHRNVDASALVLGLFVLTCCLLAICLIRRAFWLERRQCIILLPWTIFLFSTGKAESVSKEMRQIIARFGRLEQRSDRRKQGGGGGSFQCCSTIQLVQKTGCS